MLLLTKAHQIGLLRRRVTDRSHEVSVGSSAVDGGGDNGGRGAGSKSVGEGDIAGRSRGRVGRVGRAGRARNTSADGRRHNQDGGGNDGGAVVVGTLGVEDIVVVAGFTKSRQSGHEGVGHLVEQHGEGLVDQKGLYCVSTQCAGERNKQFRTRKS